MRQEIKDRIEMLRNGEVPEGYKEVNKKIIPKDWSYSKLDNYVELISGQHVDAQEYNTVGEGIPYLTGPSDFSEGVIKATKFTEKPKTKCKKGDILITVKGSGVGKTIIADDEYCISRQLMAIRSDDSVRSVVYYHLKNNETEYNSDSVGLIPGITRTEILSSRFPIAESRYELNKIGEIISTWDKAIEMKEQLIEQKKEQKRGLMKKLFTGEVRLPGFDGEWKEVKLSEIANQSTLKNNGNLDIRVLSCTKYDGLVDSLEYFGRKMFSDDISKYKIVKKGQICYATNHIEEGSIGIMNKFDVGLVSPMYTVFEVNSEHDSNYVFQVLKSERYVELYKSLMSASVNRRGSLRWNEFSEIKITCPTYEEQKSIANFINFVNYHIDLLQQKLEALKLQKKGLMQLLLTGIVRTIHN